MRHLLCILKGNKNTNYFICLMKITKAIETPVDIKLIYDDLTRSSLNQVVVKEANPLRTPKPLETTFK